MQITGIKIDPYRVEYENYATHANGQNLGQSLEKLQNQVFELQREQLILINLTEELKKEIYNYKFVMGLHGTTGK